ncbi:limonene-1,2-epoxide hydrolase family protein [Novosphingobium jiangmenense]|uniref:Nuclear transport factor 2 family protein n=1 Tax=Novosphingobium jiangmenense TaxID=2791981 RepID=A0ABS0HK11_9SPHN|nr:limonene-1,2-epoxide hydrolase family protein [Novosphingobium jiangmenense]MBF9152345.1 nuclear transport factor 2 family protein [Novosphingobium jiangmenense]
MSEDAADATRTVMAFLKAMETLDYDRAVMLVADDCEYTNPPPIGTVTGPAGIRAVLQPFFAPTLENEFRVLRAAQSGAVVFTERLDRHKLADRWVELPVTGVFEVRDRQITYWRDYFNAATILSQWPAG